MNGIPLRLECTAEALTGAFPSEGPLKMSAKVSGVKTNAHESGEWPRESFSSLSTLGGTEWPLPPAVCSGRGGVNTPLTTTQELPAESEKKGIDRVIVSQLFLFIYVIRNHRWPSSLTPEQQLRG